MQNKINIGIIGKNFGYKVIYKSFIKNKKYKVVGFSFKSKNKDRLKLPKKIKIYNNWKNLILNKKIHAVVIATPPFYHKKIIQFALKNNKHIFCEKPLACTNKEALSLCNLTRKKRISHMVNYEFSEIEAFSFFKNKILKKIKIKKIFLNWFINIENRPKATWKENHSKGGGIMFNYICHSIYYLEFLLGKMIKLKTNISFNKKNKIQKVRATFFFKKNITANLDIKAGPIKKYFKPTHELKILSNNKTYYLKTKLNSLSDKFELLEFDHKKQFIRSLYKEKKSKDDFRIRPTYKNSIKFSNSILRKSIDKPNFYTASRIHTIINKMIISSKIKKIRFSI